MLKQRGFTLIELIVIVSIFAVLTIVVTRTFSGSSSDSAKSEVLFVGSQKLFTNWRLLVIATGTTSDTGSSGITKPTSSALDVLVSGSDHVATQYQRSYRNSGLIPMTDLVEGTVGNYTLSGYSVSLSGGGGNALVTTISDVPDEVVLHLVQRHSRNITALNPAGDNTNPVIRYSPSSSGTRQVTIRSL